ncbi:MAG: DUF4173 domain-containing protein [Eubacteriales bacterium]
MNIQTHRQDNADKNQLLFAAISVASFLVLLYGSIFKGIPMGINVLLFIGVCYGCMVAFFDVFLVVLKESIFQTVVVILLGSTFLMYNNLILLTINAFLIFMIVGAQFRFMIRMQKDPLFSAKIVRDACVVWFGYSLAGIPGAFKTLGQEKKLSGVKGLIIGIAVAIPLLAAVLALLVSADIAFSEMFKNIFKDINAADVIGYSIASVLIFVCAGGLYFSMRNRHPKPDAEQHKILNLNKIALMLVVGCIDTVLVVFAALQFGYLFAGNVPAGYTYAQYAQNGFWQLVAVAVIVAAIVFLAQSSSSVRTENSRALKTMLSVLCVLTEVVLVSAFWRMALYELAFSFSILRVFTQAFMVATAVVFAVLVISLWKRDFKLMKWIFVAGMVVYLGLNFMNADAFIAQQNTSYHKQADIQYLSQLSVDALPYYADQIDARIKEKEDVEFDYEYDAFCRGLVNIREGVEKASGWQYFNVSREQAKAYITRYSNGFDTADVHVKNMQELYND